MTSSSYSPSPLPSDDDDYTPVSSHTQPSQTRKKRGDSVQRGRGRSRGTRANRAVEARAEEDRRVEEHRRERISATQNLLQDLSFEDLRSFTMDVLQWQPGLVFDVLALRQNNAPPPSAGLPGLPWCTCQNCRDMPTDRERKCCRQTPNNCISNLPHFRDYCLDGGFLRIHRQYREDITALGHAIEPGSESREFRYAAYRHFIYWQHGSLGAGKRLVIPSCCVCKIRDTFPDPQGQYTGFIPGF